MTTTHTTEQRYGMILRFTQDENEDFDEAPGGSTPDSITYTPIRTNTLNSYATGFVWNHPNGATLSAELPAPVLAAVATTVNCGIPSHDLHYEAVEKAIRARLGAVAETEDLDMGVGSCVDFMMRAL